jgi:hypothetical protein
MLDAGAMQKLIRLLDIAGEETTHPSVQAILHSTPQLRCAFNQYDARTALRSCPSSKHPCRAAPHNSYVILFEHFYFC